MDQPRSRTTDRLFFAVYPPADVAEQIQRLAGKLREEHRLRGRAHGPDRSHVTLAYLGDHIGLPEELVDRATTAASKVVAAPFQVVFDRAASFHGRPRNRPFVLLGGEGLAMIKAMREVLRAALDEEGVALDAAYVPHVTLLYDDKAVPEQAVKPIIWTVTDFVLMRSRIGEGRHDPIGRWSLV